MERKWEGWKEREQEDGQEKCGKLLKRYEKGCGMMRKASQVRGGKKRGGKCVDEKKKKTEMQAR